jgi:rare lipoprotein A
MVDAETPVNDGTSSPHRFRRASAALASAFALAVLAGCSSTPPSSPTAASVGDVPAAQARSYRGYKIGNPYKIKGVWYYPQLDYSYDEVGIASWYGPGFHGKATANGEIYDQDDMTAAHKTLPMPSIVRVTNLDNGRSIKVRVNDRGPFVDGRIIDLSRRGAQMLGFYGAGTARVRVEIEEQESRQLAMALTGTDDPTGQLAMTSRAAAPASSPPPLPIPPVSTDEPPSPDDTPVAAYAAPVTAAYSETSAAAPIAVTEVAAVGSTPAGMLPEPGGHGDPALTDLPAFYSDSDPAVGPAEADPAAEGHLNPWQRASFRQPSWQQASWQPSDMASDAIDGRAYVQCGAFSDRGNAERAHRQLARLGPVSVIPHSVAGRSIYRVRVGPLSSLDEAGRIQAAAAQAGFSGSHIVIE